MLFHIRQRVINGYQHILACRIVKAWALLAIVHFIVQVALQGVTLRDNQQATAKTRLCLIQSNVPIGVPLLENDSLSLCDGIPGHQNVVCTLVSSEKDPAPFPTLSVDVKGLADYDLDQTVDLTVDGHQHMITGRCAASLQYMFVAFRNNAAEDIATICFQFWLLIVSLLAVLQDSIPHLAVCIASHLLDVGWAGFRIKSTIALRQEYYTYIVDGACEGEDMLGDWWDKRLNHAAPLFGTNLIVLILLAALAVILFYRYAKINCSRMGASPAINRMYKMALSFSAFLQLAALFTVLAVGMWIDLLSCEFVASLDGNVQSDQAAFFVLVVIITPWIIFGWWAIFREVKWAFILFGVFHAFLLCLWPGMFASAIFRYVLKTWSFFACVSVASYLFVVATAIMAVVCRFYFGRGLGHFLRVEADLSSSGFPASFFTNDPTEKGRSDSPFSFDFDLLDAEKARKGSMDSRFSGPVDIRPCALESSKYSAHPLSFQTSKRVLESPIVVALTPTRGAGAAIVQAINKGVDKAVPPMKTNPRSRPTTADKDEAWIQPPAEAYLRDPYKETRSRKETPSLLTQATGISSNSCSQVVVTFARKDPVVRATARAVATSTMYSGRSPSPVDSVIPREDRPIVDLGARGKIVPQPDRHGRI